MLAVALWLAFLMEPPAKPLPVSAHNCYSGASSERLKEALALGIDNVEIDLGWDEAKSRLIVGHDERPVPGASYPTFEDYVRPMLEAPERPDRAPTVLTIDWKTSRPEAVKRFKDFLDRRADLFSSAEKSESGKFVARRFTVCFTGSDAAKNHYDSLVPPGSRYLAFRDKVYGGSDYLADPSDYARTPATTYHRFLTFHWGVIEKGGPPRAGEWTKAEAERLAKLVANAHAKGYRLRFYCLNGGGSLLSLPYRFKDLETAKIRWRAAAEAGVDWVATDDYREIAAELRPKTSPEGEDADPLASFGRLTTGEWRVTAASGTSLFHVWRWGPGRRSIRRMTDGSGAGGQPWREVQVYYRHPGLKQIRMLGLSPFSRGVSEGSSRFQGERAEARFDLHQTRGLRKMGLRWEFDGPDRYHETLLEEAGPAPAVLRPLAEWDHVRSPSIVAKAGTNAAAPPPSMLPKVLTRLLGRDWETVGLPVSLRTSFEWIPYADGILVRLVEPGKTGESASRLDAYLYHHTGSRSTRCLALSDRGEVFEGDLTVLEGDAVELDLKRSDDAGVERNLVRFDFEKDGTIRQRVWSLRGNERTPTLDVRHRRPTEPAR